MIHAKNNRHPSHKSASDPLFKKLNSISSEISGNLGEISKSYGKHTSKIGGWRDGEITKLYGNEYGN